jgi:hypothetical protein
MRAGSHLGRDYSMRLVDGVRRILRLGGGSRVEISSSQSEHQANKIMYKASVTVS